MRNERAVLQRLQDPAVRAYAFVCLVALVILFLALAARGLGKWSLFPVIVGSVGLATRWRLGPLMLLVALSGIFYWQGMVRPQGRPPQGSRSPLPVPDVVMCGAVLAYVIGCFRLQGLETRLLPWDPRKPRSIREAQSGKRSTATVGPHEIAGVLAAAPLCATGAQLVWMSLIASEPALVIPRPLWWGMLLAVIGGLGYLVLAGTLSYLVQGRQSSAEALLYLQDQLWRETRREERLLNRWLTWAHLRQRRRKGNA